MAKKKHKSLLPKRIAGVKVPKAVRKGRFGELLASQTGQALIAEAVLAAGALGGVKKASDAVADKSDAHGGFRNIFESLGEELKANASGRKDAATAGAILAVAFGEAARAFVRALNEQHRPAQPELAPEPADGSKKKPRSLPRALGGVPAPLKPSPTPVWRPPPTRGDFRSKLAAVGVRSLVRFAHWRGRRDAAKDLRRRGSPVARGFIQINLIRGG